MASTPMSRLSSLLSGEASRSQSEEPTNTISNLSACAVCPTQPKPARNRSPEVRVSEAAPKPLTKQPASGLSSKPIAEPNSRVSSAGEPGAPGPYCPVLAVSRLPYKFMDAQSSLARDMSRDFFSQGKFWNRRWTLYYLHLPPALAAKPLIVVPAVEVEDFLAGISATYRTTVRVPVRIGFSVYLGPEGAPSPRFLGVSFSKQDMQTLENTIPSMSLDFSFNSTGQVVTKCSDAIFESWMEQMEDACRAAKGSSKSSRTRRESRSKRRTDWIRQLQWLQRCLGLKVTENQAANARDMVFVAVDVEVFERNHNLVTEIGLAAVESSAVSCIDPGPEGRPWLSLVRGRHFWIKENSHLENHVFVAGCPRSYAPAFGDTELVPLHVALSITEGSFDNPEIIFSERLRCGGAPRNIVLVGHGIEADVRFLNAIGCNLTGSPNIVEILDTAELHMVLDGSEQPRNLGALLYEFGIEGWNLHNAGNDAAYTLQLLLAIAVRAANSQQPD